jgi:hypothetical protein
MQRQGRALSRLSIGKSILDLPAIHAQFKETLEINARRIFQALTQFSLT